MEHCIEQQMLARYALRCHLRPEVESPNGSRGGGAPECHGLGWPVIEAR